MTEDATTAHADTEEDTMIGYQGSISPEMRACLRYYESHYTVGETPAPELVEQAIEHGFLHRRHAELGNGRRQTWVELGALGQNMLRHPEADEISATFERAEAGDFNWAEAATSAWLAAAREAGLEIEDQDYDDHGESVAARVQVGGDWYDLEVGRGGDPDEVRAVPLA